MLSTNRLTFNPEINKGYTAITLNRTDNYYKTINRQFMLLDVVEYNFKK